MRNKFRGIPKRNKNARARQLQFVARQMKEVIAQKPVLRKKSSSRSHEIDVALGLKPENPV